MNGDKIDPKTEKFMREQLPAAIEYMRAIPDIKPDEKRGVWTKQMLATRRKQAARRFGKADIKPDI